MCSRISTKLRKQHAACVSSVISVVQRKGELGGDDRLRALRIPLLPQPSKPRWRPRRQNKFTANDHKSRSSRTPGSKSDVDSANFDAGEESRYRWRLSGLVSATTSSGGSAYAAKSMRPQQPRGVPSPHRCMSENMLRSASAAPYASLHSPLNFLATREQSVSILLPASTSKEIFSQVPVPSILNFCSSIMTRREP